MTSQIHSCANKDVFQEYVSTDPYTIHEIVPHCRIMAPTPASSKATPSDTRNSSTITAKLLGAIPSQADIKLLLARMSNPPPMYYQFDYNSCCSSPNEVPKAQILIPDLSQPELHPVLLARQMLLFAAALRHVPRKESVLGLSKHHHIIMDELVESAVSHVTTNDALLGTLEGLELLILESFYHFECGDARRTWITTRRAVMAAQLLGLHRPGHYRYKVIDGQIDLKPEAMWISIVCMERVSSLLLGLPSSTAGVILTEGTTTSGFIVRLGNVAGRVLERNQIEVPQQALDLTKDIDRELISIAEQMPLSFWQPSAFQGLARDSIESANEIRRALDHGRYYNLVIQLHLPHMLCPSHDSQRIYSKIACVNASREVLNRHIGLQSFQPAVSRCRMIDFPALIAGMTLMLAHAISHCGKESENMFAHQRLSDRAMVKRALGSMEFVSELHQETLIVRCARLLTELLAIEEDAASEHRHNDVQQHGRVEASGNGRNMLIMRAPFLGGIQLSKEGIAAMPTSRTDQDSSLPESTSIGGIGAIHVDSSRASDLDDDHGAFGLPEQQLNNVPNVAITDEFLTQGDNNFLDGAADLDDWAFLGTDTAFFESLMRGAGGMPIDDTQFGT